MICPEVDPGMLLGLLLGWGELPMGRGELLMG